MKKKILHTPEGVRDIYNDEYEKKLILEKDLIFYKIDEKNKKVVVYAVVDQRQDYLNIIRGL